jgi:hypothetical protein
LIRQRREAASEVVGAAVAFRLADEGDDLGGIDPAGIDQSGELGYVIGLGHRDLVRADLHRELLLVRCAGTLQSVPA